MTEKIIQIVPAPAGMVAYYETGKTDAQGRDIAEARPISCLALVEVTDTSGTNIEVFAMRPAPDSDSLEFAYKASGFIALDHSNTL